MGNILFDLSGIFRACSLLRSSYLMGTLRTPAGSFGGAEFDAQVGAGVISNWHSLKAGSKLNRRRASEITARIASIFDIDGFDIDVAQSGGELIASVQGQSYRLAELGSGLGHFIVAIANLAGQGATSWVLVDEPENGLHPTLQAEFLTTLAGFASEGVVFATHSYGLARRMGGALYGLRRNGAESVLTEGQRTGSLAALAGEMGFSAYHDLGHDGILLVEGPTDVPSFGEFMRLLGMTPNLVILPLGGVSHVSPAPRSHLSELRRVTQRLAAIIDSEKSSAEEPLPSERQAFVEACLAEGIPCHVLDRRATENYLTDHAVKAVLGNAYQALGPYDKPKGWIKGRNWQMAAAMTAQDLESTDLANKLRLAVAHLTTVAS
jgi:hypothetical protein